ncbi:hypothetical protein GCM10011507_29380 [Edaphobacter acidisoli]|uniref:Uncharacterized protein n=1 Tax=Edaphobacter acidisoli TaxID=2040573 RepID=A0A916W8J8_9BACT|nr:hypothetical protein GCM10011507_29380 [Edaphobacter acidisoli]
MRECPVSQNWDMGHPHPSKDLCGYRRNAGVLRCAQNDNAGDGDDDDNKKDTKKKTGRRMVRLP